MVLVKFWCIIDNISKCTSEITLGFFTTETLASLWFFNITISQILTSYYFYLLCTGKNKQTKKP